MLLHSLLFFSGFAFGSVIFGDPSNVISPLLHATDNTIVPDYTVPFINVQLSAIPAIYTFSDTSND